MKLETLYRDIYSRINLNGEDHSIYKDDIVNSINDSIRRNRVEFIKEGVGYDFSITENINSFTEDAEYPFVNSASLSKKIMSELPLEYTVLSSVAFKTGNKLQDTSATYNKGDLARKDGKLYEAIDDISNINTYDLTFKPSEARNYYRNNGLIYEKEDIVYDSESNTYYKVNTGFTANQDLAASSMSELDKLYWKYVEDANVYIAHYPFKNVQTLRIFETLNNSGAVAIKNDTVYISPEIEELTLTYIPKWTDVTDFSDDIDIPDYMIPQVKAETLQLLATKLNIQIQNAEDNPSS